MPTFSPIASLVNDYLDLYSLIRSLQFQQIDPAFFLLEKDFYEFLKISRAGESKLESPLLPIFKRARLKIVLGNLKQKLIEKGFSKEKLEQIIHDVSGDGAVLKNLRKDYSEDLPDFEARLEEIRNETFPSLQDPALIPSFSGSQKTACTFTFFQKFPGVPKDAAQCLIAFDHLDNAVGMSVLHLLSIANDAAKENNYLVAIPLYRQLIKTLSSEQQESREINLELVQNLLGSTLFRHGVKMVDQAEKLSDILLGIEYMKESANTTTNEHIAALFRSKAAFYLNDLGLGVRDISKLNAVALDYFIQAFNLANLNVSITTNPMCSVSRERTGKKYLEEAYRYKLNIKSAFLLLGQEYREENNLEKAIFCYEQAKLTIKDVPVDKSVIPSIHLGLMGMYRALADRQIENGDRESALENLKRARALAKLEGLHEDIYKLDMARVYREIANKEEERGQIKDALRFLQKAWSLCLEMNFKPRDLQAKILEIQRRLEEIELGARHSGTLARK